MEYLAYSHTILANIEADSEGEFSLPESNLNLNWKQSGKSAWLSFALLGTVLAIVGQSQPASAYTQYYVNTNGSCLNVRTYASTSAPTVGCIRNGAALAPVLSYRNGFARLSTGRYVAANYISTRPGGGYRPGPGVGGSVTVGLGSQGQTVRQVQRALGLNVTGVYDYRTYYAVQRFQSRNGLRPDGVVGPQTRLALLGY